MIFMGDISDENQIFINFLNGKFSGHVAGFATSSA